jgi:hypothetical protein
LETLASLLLQECDGVAAVFNAAHENNVLG